MTKACPICLERGAENVVIGHNRILYTGGEMIDTHISDGPTIRYNILGPGVDRNSNAIMIDSSRPAITNNISLENMTLMWLDSYGPVEGGEVTYNKFVKGTIINFMCSTPRFKNNNIYGEIYLPIHVTTSHQLIYPITTRELQISMK